MSEQPPAGFYVDPEDPASHRWWDGTSWGEQRMPAPPAPPSPPAPPAQVEVREASTGEPEPAEDDGAPMWVQGVAWLVVVGIMQAVARYYGWI